jgi:hypothetical protein
MYSGDKKLIGFVTDDSIEENTIIEFFKESASFKFDIVNMDYKNKKIKKIWNSNLTLWIKFVD